MTKAILVVSSHPSAPDREDEYNDWYTDVHLQDIVDLPGFGVATRYQIVDVQANEDVEPLSRKYLAIYELDTDDVEAAAAALKTSVAEGEILVSEALDPENLTADFYVPIPGAKRP